MYIKTEDPDLPAFYYDPLIHPIAAYRAGVVAKKDEDSESTWGAGGGGCGKEDDNRPGSNPY